MARYFFVLPAGLMLAILSGSNLAGTVSTPAGIDQAIAASATSALARAPGSPAAEATLRRLDAADIPLVTGLTFVLAVHTPRDAPEGGLGRVAQGDYEMIVDVTGVDADGLDTRTRADASDQFGEPLALDIPRRVREVDLDNTRDQLLGFHTDDPVEVKGTTSLGPSRAMMRELLASGNARYALQNFRVQERHRGELNLVDSTPVMFPVVVNGERVALPVFRATGTIGTAGKSRFTEHLLLNHPRHPVTLRLTVGAENASPDATPVAVRQVVRIDFPVAEKSLERALDNDCRVEVPGIYFDFNRDSLTPQSQPALAAIARMLGSHPDWRLTIEGHTDDVGSDAYNLDLSARRAAAVQGALVREFGIDAGRLDSAGFGESRPVESNDSIEGRARNRRVELARECP